MDILKYYTLIEYTIIIVHKILVGFQQCEYIVVATNSTHVLTICSHLNSSSDSRKTSTATILLHGKVVTHSGVATNSTCVSGAPS